jgi:hypothetical protein
MRNELLFKPAAEEEKTHIEGFFFWSIIITIATTLE